MDMAVLQDWRSFYLLTKGHFLETSTQPGKLWSNHVPSGCLCTLLCATAYTFICWFCMMCSKGVYPGVCGGLVWQNANPLTQNAAWKLAVIINGILEFLQSNSHYMTIYKFYTVCLVMFMCLLLPFTTLNVYRIICIYITAFFSRCFVYNLQEIIILYYVLMGISFCLQHYLMMTILC